MGDSRSDTAQVLRLRSPFTKMFSQVFLAAVEFQSARRSFFVQIEGNVMKFFNKSKLAAGCAVALIATASIAASHATKSSNADVAARHAMMGLVGHNMGVLGSTAKGEIAFNAGLVQAAAANLNKLAQIDPTSLWTIGTEQGAADLSRAKPEIWSDAAGFSEKFEAMARASAALMDATDVEAVRAGMGALGGACKACHESYRGPKT